MSGERYKQLVSRRLHWVYSKTQITGRSSTRHSRTDFTQLGCRKFDVNGVELNLIRIENYSLQVKQSAQHRRELCDGRWQWVWQYPKPHVLAVQVVV